MNYVVDVFVLLVLVVLFIKEISNSRTLNRVQLQMRSIKRTVRKMNNIPDAVYDLEQKTRSHERQIESAHSTIIGVRNKMVKSERKEPIEEYEIVHDFNSELGETT